MSFRWLDILRLRLRSLFRRAEVERELEDEFAFHLERRAADLVSRGMAPDEARAAARRAFGGIEMRKEQSRDARGTRGLENVLRDVSSAWRSLRRTPAFSSTASVTLVVGFTATFTIFAVINAVLLRPLPYGDPDRLVAAWHDLPGVSIAKGSQTAATYFAYRKFAHSIDGIGLYQTSSLNVSNPNGNGEPRRVSSASMNAEMIPVLKVRPMLGRNFSAGEDAPGGPLVALIGEALWRSQFGGDSAVVGRNIEVGGRARTIVGVMPRSFRFPTDDVEIWTPLQLDAGNPYPGGFRYYAVARLKEGVTALHAEREFVAVLPRAAELYPNMGPGILTATALEQTKARPYLVGLHREITGGTAKMLWIVAAASGLVLLVACGNVFNLVLVRIDSRRHEFAIRAALGAGRLRLLVHFLSEVATIAVFSATFAVILTSAALLLLRRSEIARVPRLGEVHLDTVTLGVAALLTLFVVAVCGLVPALRLGGMEPTSSIREGARGNTVARDRHRTRHALVAAQVALAVIALASSGVLVRTFRNLSAVRVGFNAESVATYWLSVTRARYPDDSTVASFYIRLADAVRQIPGVRSASISSHLPLMEAGRDQDPFYPENDSRYIKEVPPLQLYSRVDGAYFGAMGIPLIAGRTFNALAVESNDAAIVSRATAAQFWSDSTGRSAVGKRFRIDQGGSAFTIIGVVGDIRDASLAGAPSQAVYLPAIPLPARSGAAAVPPTMTLVIRTHGHSTLGSAEVQRVIRELDPTLPVYGVRSMHAVVQASMADLRVTTGVVGAAAFVGLFMGAIGLYGVLAYVVTLRRRELGVRIALGASPRAIAAWVTKQAMAMTLAGTVAGILLFVPASGVLRSMLFGVAPLDPVTLLGAPILLGAIAALASWFPARRASRLDPITVLRGD